MKVKFKILKKGKEYRVVSITNLDNNVCYIFPLNLQLGNNHEILFAQKIIHKSLSSIKQDTGFRNISITLDSTLKPIYVDDEGNFVFRETYLDEDVPIIDQAGSSNVPGIPDDRVSLLTIINSLQEQLQNSTRFRKCDAEKKFHLEKFNGKGDANSWLEKFNNECERFALPDEDKLEVMRVFLMDSAIDWYVSATQDHVDDWDSIVNSFKAVFGNKSWAPVRYAIQYKYISGSLTEYLLSKQRLLKELEKNMTQMSLINLLVEGLPVYIQNRLKRADVTSVNELFVQVANHDHTFTQSKSQFRQRVTLRRDIELTPGSKNSSQAISKEIKHPCSICFSLNYPNRFHPEKFCRNKDLVKDRRKINNTELADNEGSFEIMNINSDGLVHSARSKSEKLIKIFVNIENKVFEALYDNGSTVSLIHKDVIDKLNIRFLRRADQLYSISGSTFGAGKTKIRLKIGDIEDDIDFYVIDNKTFKYQILLGLEAIRKFKLIQDENLNILQKRNNLEHLRGIKNNADNIPSNRNLNKLIKLREESFINNLDDMCEEHHSHLTLEEKRKISTLVEDNIDIFAVNKYDVGNIHSGFAGIKLTEEKYISQRPYRCSLPDRLEIEKQVSDLVNAGLVSESSSPFAAPVTLAYKKGEGKTRLCVDFRQLNKLVVPEAQPFPRIEDMLTKCYDCSYFSVLDANSAFWAIPVATEDREKLAFVTETGHYQFNVLPFGFKNSPSIFQRIITNIIRRNHLSDFTMNYIDDILIFSHTFEDHMKHLAEFFKTVRRENFKLKLTKCKFAQKSVKYLGHIVKRNKIIPMSDNLLAIKNFPIPTKKKNIRQFLGKVNFYHKFIEDGSKKLRPLFDLLKKDAVFKWTEECQSCFEMIKDYMCSPPVLAIFNPNKQIYIYTDASGEGLGAIFKQESEDKVLHPVYYFSKRLTETQRKKAPIYLECLAIKEAIVFWQHLLIGRSFTVISDHKPLENLKVKARPDEALGHLILYLTQYNFTIVYQQGKDNIEADALSRNPILEKFESEDSIRITNVIDIAELKRDQMANANILKSYNRVRTDHDVIYKLKNGRK